MLGRAQDIPASKTNPPWDKSAQAPLLLIFLHTNVRFRRFRCEKGLFMALRFTEKRTEKDTKREILS